MSISLFISVFIVSLSSFDQKTESPYLVKSYHLIKVHQSHSS
ncbi:MAG: Uncharacterised protein [Flavobacterium sp. SCGC AAA160-P02]|nr:MAG: Uncharacterised protein [Flavobacterium sp. SCGC AAA160-P02]